MPHWDFVCTSPTCDFIADVAFPCYTVMEQQKPIVCPKCSASLERRIPAPASFTVTGFNEINGYASVQTRKMRIGSTRIEVTGNPEILRDIQ